MKKLFFTLGFLFSFSVHGQDSFYASGLLGLNSTTMNVIIGTNMYSYGEGMSFSFDSEISFGFRFGVLFNDHVSVGVYLQRYTGRTFIKSEKCQLFTTPSNAPMHSCAPESSLVEVKYDYNMTFNNFLAEFTYYVNEVDENGLWISGLLGVTQIKARIPNKDKYHDLVYENSGETTFGTSLGYHFMVAPNFSISPQMSFTLFTDTKTFYNQLSGLINVTLWL